MVVLAVLVVTVVDEDRWVKWTWMRACTCVCLCECVCFSVCARVKTRVRAYHTAPHQNKNQHPAYTPRPFSLTDRQGEHVLSTR